MSINSSYRVAIVGTGPAGMYACAHLLEQQHQNIEVDLYERLPTPWGLVRAGVAPDHPEKKLVVDRLFDYFFKHPKVAFFGNIEVGADISHTELTSWYDAVIYAVGANNDRPMGIPGEDLPGCWAAREFVAWYNGHPDYSQLDFDLSHERAVIVGNGNVALDVARILVTPVEQLAKTDIADHAIEALRDSKVREVVILGRRGQAQGAFNNPELEELLHLDGVEVVVEPGDDSDNSNANADWLSRRKLATLQQLAARKIDNPAKRIVLRFLASPVAVVGETKVEQLRSVENQLEQDDSGAWQARSMGKEFSLETGLVLRAIGYRGSPLAGLPFDEQRGVISHQNGRVVDESGQPLANTYVTGWIKRGPQGVIGSNKRCASESVDALLADLIKNQGAKDKPSRDEIIQIMRQYQPQLVLRDDWLSIDRHERAAGRPQSRPRVKFTDIESMLACQQ